ncbi:MAG: hypothetical protein NDJ92_14730 [Thermoanaerobaculia bacterium]|nr:hypothetical protein [Thermoanaerobaculia bacterium]
MIAANFYSIAETTLTEFFTSHGWSLAARGDFSRQSEDGLFLFSLDPLRGFERFRVLVGFDPLDMIELIKELFGEEVQPNQAGFLCGPYLTPAGVYKHHGGYPCKSRVQLAASLVQVQRAMEQHGFAWLEKLREPAFLAENADPVAVLFHGYAWERAGGHKRAAESYEQLWQQLQEMFASLSAREWKAVQPSMKREYLWVAGRLGRQNELSNRFQSELNYAGRAV